MNLAGLVVNYLSFASAGHLKLALRMHGGEITVESGFGLRAVHIYSMTPEGATTHSLGFSPLTLIGGVVLLAAAIFLILLLIGRIKRAQKKS